MTSHPTSAPDDPLFLAVREICLGFPGAAERLSHGCPVFYTKKVFLWWRASVKGDTKNRVPTAMCVVLDDEQKTALLQSGQAFEPAYLHAWGWIAIDLAAGHTNLDEAAELIEDSYRNTAGKRLIAQLDADET